jgi:acyl-CoA thioester hydrolase
MFFKEVKIRIRYAETDRMGYAYYGNYATYFEVARVEAMRALGIPYKKLEDEGIILPVAEFHVKYKKPAYYDDEITVKVTIKEIPKIRFRFDYETYNSEGDLLNSAFTELVFVNKDNGRPMVIPDHIRTKISPYFISE